MTAMAGSSPPCRAIASLVSVSANLGRVGASRSLLTAQDRNGKLHRHLVRIRYGGPEVIRSVFFPGTVASRTLTIIGFLKAIRRPF